MTSTLTAAGGCHCGAVRFAVQFASPPTLLDCNCSICSKTGFLHLIATAGEFTLLVGAEALTDYRFGTGTARHLFCRHCGVKSFYVPRSHPEGFSINWRALDNVANIVPVITPFDGREWERGQARLAEQ